MAINKFKFNECIVSNYYFAQIVYNRRFIIQKITNMC